MSLFLILWGLHAQLSLIHTPFMPNRHVRPWRFDATLACGFTNRSSSCTSCLCETPIPTLLLQACVGKRIWRKNYFLQASIGKNKNKNITNKSILIKCTWQGVQGTWTEGAEWPFPCRWRIGRTEMSCSQAVSSQHNDQETVFLSYLSCPSSYSQG